MTHTLYVVLPFCIPTILNIGDMSHRRNDEAEMKPSRVFSTAIVIALVTRISRNESLFEQKLCVFLSSCRLIANLAQCDTPNNRRIRL